MDGCAVGACGFHLLSQRVDGFVGFARFLSAVSSRRILAVKAMMVNFVGCMLGMSCLCLLLVEECTVEKDAGAADREITFACAANILAAGWFLFVCYLIWSRCGSIQTIGACALSEGHGVSATHFGVCVVFAFRSRSCRSVSARCKAVINNCLRGGAPMWNTVESWTSSSSPDAKDAASDQV